MNEDFIQHRKLLFGIAYRMLGSVAEAEDMVQETWLRWQRQIRSEVESPQAWLVATITRLCIDQLRSARRQREEYYGVWLPEPLVEPAAASPRDTAALADSLTMAFMLLLEALSPAERAVFLLREVFDYEYAEIARVVGKTEANCRQIVRRAKGRLTPSTESTTPPSDRAREVVQKFLAAMATGEVTDFLTLLTGDAVLYTDGGGRVAAAGRPIHSADHISRFFVGIRSRAPAHPEYRFVRINGREGVLASMDGAVYNAMSFELEGDRVRAIYVVRNPEKLRHLTGGSPHFT